MARNFEELEHDTLVDPPEPEAEELQPAPTLEPPKPQEDDDADEAQEPKGPRTLEELEAMRLRMAQKRREDRGEDWMNENNPHLWEGEIDED